MVEKTVAVQNESGLHMRPAEMLVQAASKFEAEIHIVKDDLSVNGKSIMGVLMLAAEYGSQITIRAEGTDEQAALDRLIEIMNEKFGEP